MPRRLRAGAPVFAFVILAAACLLPPASDARAAEAPSGDEAVAFISDLGEKAIDALADPAVAPKARRARFRELLKKGLDLHFVSRFVLGSYRRRIDDDQMARFQELLEENIVQNYAWRFRNYNGQRFEVTGVRDAERKAKIVETRVSQEGEASPIRVDWRVHKRDGALRIIDIVVEGISMMVTQRDEYVGFMRANGGIEPLLAALEKQNAEMAQRYEED